MNKGKAPKRHGDPPARPALDGAPCGCRAGATPSAHPARNGVGPGAHAAGVDNEIKAANLKHLRRIEGQVRGIAAMVNEDRYCADIIIQAAAVQESLRTVAKNLLKNHLRHCAADALEHGGTSREKMIEEVLALLGTIAR